MTRRHRLVHRLAWPLVAVAVAIGFTLALSLRPPPASETPAAALEPRP